MPSSTLTTQLHHLRSPPALHKMLFIKFSYRKDSSSAYKTFCNHLFSLNFQKKDYERRILNFFVVLRPKRNIYWKWRLWNIRASLTCNSYHHHCFHQQRLNRTRHRLLHSNRIIKIARELENLIKYCNIFPIFLSDLLHKSILFSIIHLT